MSSADDISSRIIDALYISDSEIDTAIGSPLRKVIDAVSDQLAQAVDDNYLTSYAYDVDSKTGGDLDDFCANFGLARLIGTRATGVVTFARGTSIAALNATTIPAGTQVLTASVPQQVFQTTISSSMPIGVTSVDIPVQAVAAGQDGNLIANSPLQINTTIAGVTNVSNSSAFVGGTIDESDAQLRTRFKTTVFRNLAGTDAMYRGIALQTLADLNNGSFGVSQVNVIGSTVHHTEQLQTVSGNATSTFAQAAYIIASSVALHDANGVLWVPRSNYTVTINNSVSPATIQISLTGNVPVGGSSSNIFTLEFDYVPLISRNDPFNSRYGQGTINNRVDVYVNGQNTGSASQTIAYVPTVKFTNTSTDALYAGKFSTLTGTTPAVNDVFIPLGFGPVLSLPATIPFAGLSPIPALGTNYDIVYQNDAFGLSPSSMYGIWWKTTTNSSNPTTNQQISINYTYNSVPYSVANNLAAWRLLGTDVQVHAGKIAYLVINFAIVYNSNVNPTTVNANVRTALDTYIKQLGFNAAVQISDIIQVAHNVPGVDNIRILSGSDSTTYGIQLVQSDGTVIRTYANAFNQPIDVYFDERTYPLLQNVAFTAKASNTFRN